MFCEVERSYIEDGFNLYGLRACVSNFSDCLDLILDRIGPDDSDDSHLTQSACTLYGLIHARYIITAHGLDAMYNKVRTRTRTRKRLTFISFQNLTKGMIFSCSNSLSIYYCTTVPQHLSQYASKEYGTCPLVQCAGQPVLPLGLRDEMGQDTVKIFCPKCQCVYHPPPLRSRSSHHSSVGTGGTSGVDGASFGTTFPHLFLITFSNLVPDLLPADSAYVPRVFGFRVHQTARHRNNVTSSGASLSTQQNQNTNAPSASRRIESGKGTGAEEVVQESSKKTHLSAEASNGQANAPRGNSASVGNEGSAPNERTGNKKSGKSASSEGINNDGQIPNKQEVGKNAPSSKRKANGESAINENVEEIEEANENGSTQSKVKRPKRQNV